MFIQNRPQVRLDNGLMFNDPDLDPCIFGHPLTSYFQVLNRCYILNINRYAKRFWKSVTSVCLILFLIYSEILNLNLLSPDQIQCLWGIFPVSSPAHSVFTWHFLFCIAILSNIMRLYLFLLHQTIDF